MEVESPHPLPRALRVLANDAVVTRNGPHPPATLEPSPPGASLLNRAGRATPRATSSGHERYLADSHGHFKRAVIPGTAADLDYLSRPKLHGMQALV